MNEVRDAAEHFEAELVRYGTNTAGDWILNLKINPMELPKGLYGPHLKGSRWTVAMVMLNDADEIVMTEEQQEGVKAVQLAGILCQDPDFMKWMAEQTGEPVFDADDCRDCMCSILGITSRKELKDDEVSRRALYDMKHGFDTWRNQ